jgi:hypothetical protein
MPYTALFPAGSQVRITDRLVLERFFKTWKYHNPLKAEQLPFAGKVAIVSRVGFYHGGDPLYMLDEVPGVWHEQCLTSADRPDRAQSDGRLA